MPTFYCNPGLNPTKGSNIGAKLKKIEIPVCSSLDAFNIANMDQNKMTQ
jgi:hypothetical protein